MIYSRYRRAVFYCVFIIAILQSCSEKITNPGSQANVHGILLTSSGAPARGAVVRFVKSGSDPRTGLTKRMAVVDSTVTGNDGSYSAQIDTGMYNVLASSDSGLSYQDSVLIEDSTTVPLDTLKAPGGIAGRVELQNADDPRTVFVLVLGAGKFTSPSANGAFSLQTMAEGTYHVRILSTLDDYSPLDTHLTVRAGTTDTLPGNIILPFRGIPITTGLAVQYDTLKQIASLSWSQTDTALTKGFNVYRMHQDSSFVNINNGLLLAPTFVDSNLIQDATYEYKVTVMNKSDDEGGKSAGISIVAISAYVLDTILGSTGVGNGQFNGGSYGIAIDKNGNVWALDAGNARVQAFSLLGDFLKAITIPAGVYQDMAIDTALNIYVAESQAHDYVLKLDTMGVILDSVMVVDPYALFINGNGQLLVGESSLKIRRFDDSLHILDSISASFMIQDMVQDSDGNIYLADASRHVIAVLDTNGALLRQWGEKGTKIRQFSYPVGLCFDASGKLYVADSDNHRIQFFNSAGDFTGQLQLGQKTYPSDLAISDSGDIYITDVGGQFLGGQYRVLKYRHR